MFVRQLIGRQAGQIVEMPYHAATSNVAMGTAAEVTDAELEEAGLAPSSAPLEAAPAPFPVGYRAVDSGGAGFDVLGPDGEAINAEMLPNLAAARAAAEAHAAMAESPSGPVEIPEGWAALPWNELLALGRQVDPDVKNKEQVTAAIEAELARRAEPPAA